RAARARGDAAAVGRALRPAGRRTACAAGRLRAPAPRAAARGRPAGARRRRSRRRPARPGRRSRLARARAPRGADPLRMTGPRRLNEPRPARVRADAGGRPLAVEGRAVEAVRESWLGEGRWWTDRPLRRRYWEVGTSDGSDVVVFRDLIAESWV